MIASKEAPRKPGHGLPWPDSILAAYEAVRAGGGSLDGFSEAVRRQSGGLVGRLSVRAWITLRPPTLEAKSHLACRKVLGFTAAELPPPSSDPGNNLPQGFPTEADLATQEWLTEVSADFRRFEDAELVSLAILYSARVEAGQKNYLESR